MTEFQVVVRGRVRAVYRSYVKAMADAQAFVAETPQPFRWPLSGTATAH